MGGQSNMALELTRRPSKLFFKFLCVVTVVWFLVILQFLILGQWEFLDARSQPRQFRVVVNAKNYALPKDRLDSSNSDEFQENEIDFDFYLDERRDDIGISYEADKLASRNEHTEKGKQNTENDLPTQKPGHNNVQNNRVVSRYNNVQNEPKKPIKRATVNQTSKAPTANTKFTSERNFNIEKEKSLMKKILHDLVHLSPASSPGEFGRAVSLNLSDISPEERKLVQEGYRKTGFNEYVSNMISLRRRKTDFRPKKCRGLSYPADLPRTTVIICFHNEAWSALLRTVFSVLDNTPPHLLQELILVDDFSDDGLLRHKLSQYVPRLPRVRMVRADRRLGLVGARLLGAASVKSQVITFLDSHVECLKDWLEPMLAQIRDRPSTVPYPVVHGINQDDFSFHEVASEYSGLFNWVDLSYYPIEAPRDTLLSRISRLEPVPTPIMPGGIFSISKSYFDQLGGYDPGLKLWGSENIELSVKSWMCNGSVELLPCSQVTHVYRDVNPNVADKDYTILQINAMRVAYVWMDDYKRLFFNNVVKDGIVPEFGDVRQRIKLRKKLGCRSFDWYLKNVAPNLYSPISAFAVTKIENAQYMNMCLTHSLFSLKLLLEPCDHAFVPQFLWYFDKGQFLASVLKQREAWACLTVSGTTPTLTTECNSNKKRQQWSRTNSDAIRNMFVRRCIDVTPDHSLTLAKCSGKLSQTWIWNTPTYSLNDVFL